MSFVLRQSAVQLLRFGTRHGIKNTIKETRNIKRWVAPTLMVLKRRQKENPPELSPRSSYLEFNYDAEVYAFGKRLGEQFDEEVLRKALTHRSYNLKNDSPDLSDNRELIDEGEMFIKRQIRDVYSKQYPDDFVEVLINYFMSESMLAHVAKHMGLTDIILCADFPVETKTLADTFKAVVAALQHSSDEARAALFVNDFLFVQLTGKDIFDVWNIEKPYQYLTGLLKEKGVTEIEPRLCNESAINTILANYQVGLYSNKKLLGIGWGESVDIAKETAALDAIERIYKNHTSTSK